MYELKKIGKVLTSKSVGTGPSSYEKRIYRAAVWQRLRNTALSGSFCTRFLFYDVMGRSTEESCFDFQQRQQAYTSSTATRGLGGSGVGLTTHFHLVPTLRIGGAIPPIPHIPSWRVRRQLFLHFSFRALQFNYYNLNNKRIIIVWNWSNWCISLIHDFSLCWCANKTRNMYLLVLFIILL